MFSVLLKALASLSMFVSAPTDDVHVRTPPTVDISAVRYIDCGDYVGSGFLIGKKVLATALHVASGQKCVDKRTGTPLKMYKKDVDNDLALMTGPGLPTDIPYIKVGCSRFHTGEKYLSWGETPYEMDSWNNPIQRMNVITATDEYADVPLYNDLGVKDGEAKHVRVFKGAIAPGMSGAPVTDMDGVALALNNAGDDKYTLLHEFADGMLCKK